MNLVGRTVMILLFGQQLDGDAKSATNDESLAIQAQIHPLTTALVLLERQKLVTAEEAARIAVLPNSQIRAALEKLAAV
jgi:hypothetical protein